MGPRCDVVTQIDGSLSGEHFTSDQVRLFRSEVHTAQRRGARCHQAPLLEEDSRLLGHLRKKYWLQFSNVLTAGSRNAIVLM